MSDSADVSSDTGWDFFSPDLTDGMDAWGSHTDTYVVPAGQVCTRFAFRAVSAAGGNPSIGNFLDGVGFQVAVPASPTPRPRPTPPVTATLATQSASSDFPSALPLLALAGLGLVAGAWHITRRARRRTD